MIRSAAVGAEDQGESPSEPRAPHVRFGPDRRLRTAHEFRQAQAGAVRVQTEPFIVLLNKRKEADAPSRLGMIASRKVGNAVRRNRIKRLLREAFRTGLIRVPDGTDVVVICRSGLPHLSLRDVDQAFMQAQGRLRKALDKLGLGRPEEKTAPRARS